MNSEAGKPSAQEKPVFFLNTVSRFTPAYRQLMRFSRLAICVLLALLAIASIQQTVQTQNQIARERLLEVALQDLIVQSMALQHLAQPSYAGAETSFAVMGYTSPQELLNQLASRISVIEAATDNQALIGQLRSLRGQLVDIDTELDTLQALSQLRLQNWFGAVGNLHKQYGQPVHQHSKMIEHLHYGIYLLAVVLLFFSLLAFAWLLKPHTHPRSNRPFDNTYLPGGFSTDPLTGLITSQGWRTIMETRLRSGKEHRLTSVAVTRIDYFSQYRETYGDESGKKRLQVFADALRNNFRPGDHIARISEAEFAILLTHCTAQDAGRILDRLRTGNAPGIRFSAGVCEVRETDSFEHVMALADQALYQAQNKGRNSALVG